VDMEEKEYIKILRNDDLEKFKEVDLVIQSYSFFMHSNLLIPFFNERKKLKIANYIVDTHPELDYSNLAWEILSHKTSLDYSDELFDKILNKATMKTLSESQSGLAYGAFKILVGTDYFLKNRHKFNVEKIPYGNILDMYCLNERTISEKSVRNVFKNAHRDERIEEVFLQLLKTFRTTNRHERTQYKTFLDNAAVFISNTESIINHAINPAEKGLLLNVITKAEIIRKDMVEEEKKEILKSLKPVRKTKNIEKKKRI